MSNPVAVIEFEAFQLEMIRDVSEIRDPPFDQEKYEYTKEDVEALNKHVAFGVEAGLFENQKTKAYHLVNWLAEIIEELGELQ